MLDRCRTCRQAANPLYMCDKEAPEVDPKFNMTLRGFFFEHAMYCGECFEDRPCRTEPHEEGCETVIFSNKEVTCQQSA